MTFICFDYSNSLSAPDERSFLTAQQIHGPKGPKTKKQLFSDLEIKFNNLEFNETCKNSHKDTKNLKTMIIEKGKDKINTLKTIVEKRINRANELIESIHQKEQDLENFNKIIQTKIDEVNHSILIFQAKLDNDKKKATEIQRYIKLYSETGDAKRRHLNRSFTTTRIPKEPVSAQLKKQNILGFGNDKSPNAANLSIPVSIKPKLKHPLVLSSDNILTNNNPLLHEISSDSSLKPK